MSRLHFCPSASRRVRIKTWRKEAAVHASRLTWKRSPQPDGAQMWWLRHQVCLRLLLLFFVHRHSNFFIDFVFVWAPFADTTWCLMSSHLRASSHAINQLFSREVWWCHTPPPSFTPIMATADDETSIPSISAWWKERWMGGDTSDNNNHRWLSEE